MTDLLVFAVVPADRFDPAILAAGEGLLPGLRSIAAGPLAAVVGAAPEGGLKGRERSALLPWLLASQKVMERLLVSAPVLPVALGTVVEDEGRVRHMLDAGAAVLGQGFQAVGEGIEMNLAVLWHLDTVVARLLPSVAPELRQAAAGGDEIERRVLGTVLAGLVAAERRRVRAKVVEELQAVTRDFAISEPTEPGGVVSLALLVDRAAETALGAALEALDAEFDGALTFRLVGPLPPYSFASVQVHLAPATKVCGARTALGVEPGASPAAVKAAYHRAARDSHPDLVPMNGDEHDEGGVAAMADETARFVTLSDAYRVLEAEYAPVSLRRLDSILTE
ncbi:GvpL/GvpF family gas vesicle protein [Ancylobacter sp. FA202]|uniref:GvpL/GvpF family gas vesicle protein n=1 Tax=Ancylobacter sp. FA202 TaxID=1111106 RepID=UPI00035C857B|nr:GvpL/GvpF family gas vesicle protein [Ancylobacter sp. FA202]